MRIDGIAKSIQYIVSDDISNILVLYQFVLSWECLTYLNKLYIIPSLCQKYAKFVENLR